MSRKSEVQIILPFEFRYSDKGGFHTEHAVTVRAPSLPDFAVHNSMVGYAKAAEIGTAVAFSAFRQKMADVVAEDTASDVPEPAETDQEMADRVLGVYATGLGAEKFPALMEYLKKALTNNSRLASVGDTTKPLDDKVWNNIAEQGGMDAINIIIATFANFFLSAPRSASRKETGDDLSTSSPSDRVLQ